MRLLLIAALALVTASGCNRRDEQAATPPAPAPVDPLTYAKKTPSADLSVTLPEAVAKVPALYAQLYGREKAALDSFAIEAATALEKMKAAGFPERPHARKVEYSLAAETPRLISLRVLTFEDTGGAHPNTVLSGVTWDKQANLELQTKDLFAAGSDLAGADKALCDAIKAEKRRRSLDDSFNANFPACPTLLATRTTLRPSTTPGKAGGLTALFSPYDIGPYVEGGYEIDVPASALEGALKPDYAAEFGGAPTPRPAGG